MGKLINRYMREIHGEVQRKEQSGDILSRYRDALENNDQMEVIFSYSDLNGNLSYKDPNNVTIKLRAEDLVKDMPYYTKKLRESFVGRAFQCAVLSIDEETKTVYVRSSRKSDGSVKKRIISELQKELDNGKHPIVAGRVINATNKRVLVNLFDQGIMGLCYAPDWQPAYTGHLERYVHEGEVIDFELWKAMTPMKGKSLAFQLSRKNIAPDPWTQVPEEFAKKGAIIVVKCVDKPQDKTYWWGYSEMLNGIDIMGDYSRRMDYKVMLGQTYRCMIDRVDLKEHFLRVVPLEIVTDDAGTLEAIKFLTTKGMKTEGEAAEGEGAATKEEVATDSAEKPVRKPRAKKADKSEKSDKE